MERRLARGVAESARAVVPVTVGVSAAFCAIRAAVHCALSADVRAVLIVQVTDVARAVLVVAALSAVRAARDERSVTCHVAVPFYAVEPTAVVRTAARSAIAATVLRVRRAYPQARVVHGVAHKPVAVVVRAALSAVPVTV